MSRIAAVVLAAGASRRLGEPKQLVRIGGESLIRRAAQSALASRAERVFCVLGARAEQMREALAGLDLEIVVAADWREGLGHSIAAAAAVLARAQPAFDGALLLVVDQPALTAAVLDGLIDAFEAGPHAIVASEYAGTLGTPTLFAAEHFAELGALRGDRGAKALLVGRPVSAVPFSGGEDDLDTPEDLKRLDEALGPDGPSRPTSPTLPET